MARTELHTCRTPACLAFAESADASGIVASRKSLERMTDSRNGTSPQAAGAVRSPSQAHALFSTSTSNSQTAETLCQPRSFLGTSVAVGAEKNKAPKQ